MIHLRGWNALFLAALLFVAGCERHGVDRGVLPQRGYLWQRAWNAAVVAGVREAGARMNGIVVLGAEVEWREGASRVTKPDIDWQSLRAMGGGDVSVAIRVDPFPGPFSATGGPCPVVLGEARRLAGEAKANGVVIREYQLDFDCAQKKLAGYAVWVRALRSAIAPVPLVITTLPAWLDEPDFPGLCVATGGFVLQVHSVPTLAESGHAVLYDPGLARKWVAKASRVGVPFSVSLPAYWCVAGYDKNGKLAGVAMDSVIPPWPAGTSLLDFSADADEIAGLVAEWTKDRPANLVGLLWYRLPIATDERNWRWPTLAAVMAGRAPEHRVEVVCEGGSPLDISIINNGEAEEFSSFAVTLDWQNAAPVAYDALPGWMLTLGKDSAVFKTTPGERLRLSPGQRRSIGWIRYDKEPLPQGHVAQAETSGS